jgi:hypothetical protein
MSLFATIFIAVATFGDFTVVSRMVFGSTNQPVIDYDP